MGGSIHFFSKSIDCQPMQRVSISNRFYGGIHFSFSLISFFACIRKSVLKFKLRQTATNTLTMTIISIFESTREKRLRIQRKLNENSFSSQFSASFQKGTQLFFFRFEKTPRHTDRGNFNGALSGEIIYLLLLFSNEIIYIKIKSMRMQCALCTHEIIPCVTHTHTYTCCSIAQMDRAFEVLIKSFHHFAINFRYSFAYNFINYI